MAIVLDGTAGITTPPVTVTNTIGVGGTTPSASGAGVSFPATQSASTDVNTLDDYEEGTWTAGLTCGTSGTITVDPAYSTCRYTKVGRVVTVVGFIYISAASSPTGSLTLTGLPFASAYTAGTAFYPYNMNTISTINGNIGGGASTIAMQTFSAGTANLAVAQYFPAFAGFMISFTYFTS
jgi:hypothetical protein